MRSVLDTGHGSPDFPKAVAAPDAGGIAGYPVAERQEQDSADHCIDDRHVLVLLKRASRLQHKQGIAVSATTDVTKLSCILH